MNRTAVIFSPKYYQHNPGKGHPESAQRLRAIVNELKKGQLSNSDSWLFVEPEKASLADIELVHRVEYIKLVEAVCRSGGGLLDLEDTVVSPASFEVALYAVGGAVKAVNLTMTGKFHNAFALVRPPGHHASTHRACGFCIFNNTAIAAEYLLEKFKLKRILILDIDAHHGNGIQETFYKTNKVLYLSLHEGPHGFPGTGFIREVGESEGLGYNVNIPLPFGTGDDVYLKAINEIAEPIMDQYNPQFMLVSAGFDAHYADPVGNLSLSEPCYRRVFEVIVNLASAKCGGKLVSILEGGYNTVFIGKLAAIAIARMSAAGYSIDDKAPIINGQVRRHGERVLDEVKRVQRSFWKIS
jgi:acetoin utilization deacetylase AcuC-like enzyme